MCRQLSAQRVNNSSEICASPFIMLPSCRNCRAPPHYCLLVIIQEASRRSQASDSRRRPDATRGGLYSQQSTRHVKRFVLFMLGLLGQIARRVPAERYLLVLNNGSYQNTNRSAEHQKTYHSYQNFGQTYTGGRESPTITEARSVCFHRATFCRSAQGSRHPDP
jgi:hypothetical protein